MDGEYWRWSNLGEFVPSCFSPERDVSACLNGHRIPSSVYALFGKFVRYRDL